MSGLWQVYAKKEGNWTTWGEPTTRADAEAIVADLWVPLLAEQKQKLKKSKIPYSEPHCVPI